MRRAKRSSKAKGDFKRVCATRYHNDLDKCMAIGSKGIVQPVVIQRRENPNARS